MLGLRAFVGDKLPGGIHERCGTAGCHADSVWLLGNAYLLEFETDTGKLSVGVQAESYVLYHRGLQEQLHLPQVVLGAGVHQYQLLAVYCGGDAFWGIYL